MKKILVLLCLFVLTAYPQKIYYYYLAQTYDVAAETYISRVESDGGIVVDKKALNDTIKAIKLRGTEWDDLIFLFNYKFGVKKDANNKVTKWYDIKNSLDLVQADTLYSPVYNADYIKFDGSYKKMEITKNNLMLGTSIICFWANVKSDIITGIGSFFSNSWGGAIPNAGTVDFNLPGVSPTPTYLLFNHGGSVSSWHTFKYWYDKDAGANNQRIVRDGAVVAQQTRTGAVTANTGNFVIGPNPTYPLRLAIKELRLYSKIH